MAKASLFKTKAEDGTSSVEIKDSINVKYSISRGWTPFGRLNLKTTKGVYFMSTEWTVITADLSSTSLDVMLLHFQLHCEYLVMGDTAHTPLEMELLPISKKENISGFVLLARCSQPPYYLNEGQILAQAIPVPKEISAEGKSPEVYWAEVGG